MPPNPNSPTLIFVHGAWHSPTCWTPLLTHLQNPQSPYPGKCIALSLPTNTGNPSLTYASDILFARSAITSELSLGNDVILILHSYGGWVGSSACKGLTDPSLRTPSVRGICLISSGFALTGQSLIEEMGGSPPRLWKIDLISNLTVLQSAPQEVFYHDLPPGEADTWAGELRPMHRNVWYEGGEEAYAGWMDVPVWYLVALEDRTLPVGVQRMMVEGARAKGADVTVREVGSGHFPMLSRVEETAGWVLEAVEAMAGKEKAVVETTV